MTPPFLEKILGKTGEVWNEPSLHNQVFQELGKGSHTNIMYCVYQKVSYKYYVLDPGERSEHSAFLVHILIKDSLTTT